MKNNNESLVMHSEEIKQLNPALPWRTDAPPQDGTAIVAIGKVIYTDGCTTVADPFVVALTWGSNQYREITTGWHYWNNGMSLASTLEDEVIIDYWLPMP